MSARVAPAGRRLVKVAIAWLRHDLRLADNPLFRFAVPPEQLLCVYVLDEAWLAPLPGVEVPRIGPARLRFLWQSLIALRGELLRRGSDLLVRVGDPVEGVAGLAARHAADQVRVRRDAGRDESRQVQRLAAGCARRVQLPGGRGGGTGAPGALPGKRRRGPLQADPQRPVRGGLLHPALGLAGPRLPLGAPDP